MDLQPGTPVTIVSDIVTDGAVAFGQGEQVVVESVAPNPADPTYKYNVTSMRTGRQMQLRDVDVMPATGQPTMPMQAAMPPVGPPMQPYPPNMGPPPGGGKAKKQRPVKGQKPAGGGGKGVKIIAALLAVLLIAAGVVIVVIMMNNKDTSKQTTKNAAATSSSVPGSSRPDGSTPSGSTPSSGPSSSVPAVTTPAAVQTAPAPAPAPSADAGNSTSQSDAQNVQSFGNAEANKFTQKTGVHFAATDLRIIGNWARLSVGPHPYPQGYHGPGAQPWTNFYHRVNGTWQMVWSGTGYQHGDPAGCPDALLQD